MSDIISSYFPELSPQQLKSLKKFSELLVQWNQKINVISRKDEPNVIERHVLHSLGIAKVVQFPKNAEVLDIGTGGGLPGLPLAIVFPKTHFTLCDSIGKKCMVVQNIAEQLELENVQVQNERVEKLNTKFDYAISRAVAPSKKLLSWIAGNMNTNQQDLVTGGIYFLKGGNLSQELKETRINHKVYPMSDMFESPFFETKCIVQFKRVKLR